jgi:phage gp36-like protein
MAYCTENDLIKMISQEELAALTAESGDVPDSLVVAEAISRADAEIDAYLGTRYALPLSPVPSQAKGLSVDMAIYHLYSRRSVAPPVRRQKYETALSFLQQVAAGQAVLDGANGLLAESERVESEFDGPVRVFSRNTLGEW